jgi:small ligand-binding sensory domain FIST
MPAGSGIAVGPPSPDLALEAALAAQERLGRDHAHLALVFATGDFYPHAHATLHAVRRVTGARAVVGCSGGGVLTEAREVEGESALAVLAVHDARLVATPLLEPLAGDGLGERVAARVGPTLAEGGTLVLLPDAMGLDPRAHLAGLEGALGPVPVVGAVAAGAPLFEVADTEAARGSLAALALSGAAPVVGVAQGCVPIGEPFVITWAEDNLVHEIAGRPALAVLQDAVAAFPDGPARVRRAGLFAGIAIDPAKSPLERGDFLVRNLLGGDQATGVLAVGERVRVGQTIQFQIRDAAASREDLVQVLGSVRARLGGRRPAFGCYFDCAGRGAGLFGVPDHDVTLIRETLGPFPLGGFFGNGEFAPVARRNFFHTYTGVLVVFPE